MRNRRSLLLWPGILALLAVVSFVATEARGVGGDQVGAGTSRSDIVTIDTLAKYGRLEEPTVKFLHDAHTKALEKRKEWAKQGCATCHQQDKDGRMSLKFMRLADGSRDEVRDTYHQNCIKCHTQTAAAGEKSGPTEASCRGCHSTQAAPASGWQPIVVDKLLHARHAKVYDKGTDKCGACHHVYDKAARKTVPASKEEDVTGACVYCHKQQTTTVEGGNPETVRSVRLASHDKCISCHRTVAAGGKPSGPATCAGCHDRAAQDKIKDVNIQKTAGDDVRMKRKQPDAALIRGAKPVPAVPGQTGPITMAPVPFNHKFHEDKSATCVACHHAALDSCAKECHTVLGSKKGGNVNLAQAMHSPGSMHSCVGCHAQQQERKECAGCHAMMKKGIKQNPAACQPCHMQPADKAQAAAAAPASVPTPAEDADTAARLLKSRKVVTTTYKTDDIPEKVLINELADQYQPSEFPHRKIVMSLVEQMKDSALAGNFHADEGAVCRGCHHNSPPSLKPPRCGNCHGGGFDRAAPARPALKAAFHTQCMGCHTAMGIDGKVAGKGPDAKPVPANVDCVGCHKEKNK